LPAFEQALTLDPTNALTWVEQGEVLLSLERSEAALAAFERAIQLAPREAPAWSGKGVALEHLGRYEEAVPTLHHALQLSPQRPETIYHLGGSLLQAGVV
jgi:Flp pilus assembly protein TadD